MRKVEVELITVTPLFLGGSDPRHGPPELRPPSFRGAMRYWYRAALGGVVGDDWKKVRQYEGKVFGIASDEKEKEGQGSSISVRIRTSQKPQFIEFTKQPKLAGKDYLFWSLAESGKPGTPKHQQARKYIPEGFTFSLLMSSLRFGAQAEGSLKHATFALWLALHLGGVGARSRRLAGSLSPLRIRELEGLTFGLKKSDPGEVAEQLAKNLTTIRQSLKDEFKTEANFHKVPIFDVLAPNYCKIWVLGRASNAEMAMNFVGGKLRDFRNRRNPDSRRVVQWLEGAKIQTVERVQFGLPIVYRYINGPSGTIVAVTNRNNEEEKIERRASPLWLSALRCQDGQIIVTATLFVSQFLPENSKLAIDKQYELPKVTPPNGQNLILDWIRQDFPMAQEVNYA